MKAVMIPAKPIRDPSFKELTVAVSYFTRAPGSKVPSRSGFLAIWPLGASVSLI